MTPGDNAEVLVDLDTAVALDVGSHSRSEKAAGPPDRVSSPKSLSERVGMEQYIPTFFGGRKLGCIASGGVFSTPGDRA